GKWKFILKMTNADVPFIVEFTKNKKNFDATIYNGPEKIKIDNFEVKENKFELPIPNYEITLDLEIQGTNTIVGEHVRHNKNPVLKSPIFGMKGFPRFEKRSLAAGISLNGSWELDMTDQD